MDTKNYSKYAQYYQPHSYLVSVMCINLYGLSPLYLTGIHHFISIGRFSLTYFIHIVKASI